MKNWTKEDKDYVVAHYGVDMSLSELAAHFEVTNTALKVRISSWRKEGLPILNLRRKDVGAVSVRPDGRGGTMVFEKTEAGWVCIERKPAGQIKKLQRLALGLAELKKRGRPAKAKDQVPAPAKKKLGRPRKPKPEPEMKVRAPKRRAAKVVERFPDRKVEPSGKEWVRIDSKTWVCRSKTA